VRFNTITKFCRAHNSCAQIHSWCFLSEERNTLYNRAERSDQHYRYNNWSKL